jgi:hypothetical protein
MKELKSGSEKVMNSVCSLDLALQYVHANSHLSAIRSLDCNGVQLTQESLLHQKYFLLLPFTHTHFTSES